MAIGKMASLNHNTTTIGAVILATMIVLLASSQRLLNKATQSNNVQHTVQPQLTCAITMHTRAQTPS